MRKREEPRRKQGLRLFSPSSTSISKCSTTGTLEHAMPTSARTSRIRLGSYPKTAQNKHALSEFVFTLRPVSGISGILVYASSFSDHQRNDKMLNWRTKKKMVVEVRSIWMRGKNYRLHLSHYISPIRVEEVYI